MKYHILIAVAILAGLLSACGKPKDKKAVTLCSLGYVTYPHPMDADSAFVSAPTAFTPNADGRNDIYHLLTKNIDSSTFSYTIADSMGATVFTYPNSSGTHGWDGTVNGNASPAGSYTAFISFKASGRQVTDTCTQLLLIRANASGCLETHGQAPLISLEDQFDPTTGRVELFTGETFCN